MFRWRTLIGVGTGCLAAITASAQFEAKPIITIPLLTPEEAKTPADKPTELPPLLLEGVPGTGEPNPRSEPLPLPPIPTSKSTLPGDLVSIPPVPETPTVPAVPAPVPLPGASPYPAIASACTPAEPEPRNRLYGNFEFLYWVTQGVHVVPMVTTGAGPANEVGTLYNPQTRVLFGGHRLLNSFRPGFRVEAGVWCDPCETLGVSGRFFMLGRTSESLAGGSDGSDGSQALALPLIQAAPGQIPAPATFPAPPPYLPASRVTTSLLPPVGQPIQQAVLLGYPGQIRGTIDVNTSTDFLGGSLDLRHSMTHNELGRLEFFGGYRYLFLGDTLNRSFDAAWIGDNTGPVGSRLMGFDSWRSRNDFHGPEFGMHVTRIRGCFSTTLETSLAMGVTSSNLNVNQTRTLGTVDSQTPIYQIGDAADHTTFFSVVPEVAMKLGYQPSENVRFTAGYNVLYWSRVRRAQEQFDLTPVTTAKSDDFWAQGWNLGVEVRY